MCAPCTSLTPVSPLYGHGKGNSLGYGNFFRPHESYYIDNSGKLPHIHQQDVLQFITFRLADSLPQIKLKEYKEMMEKWEEEHPKPWNPNEQLDYEDRMEIINEWLDADYGECILKYAEVQKIVEKALKYFDGERYDLYDYIIMPNHVHILFMPYPQFVPKQLIKSIKDYTTKEINKLMGRTGTVWGREFFDRIMRSMNDYQSKAEYIKHNGDFL